MSESTISTHQFVVCVRNDEYEVSLELRKMYETMPDADASKHQQLRVIDESGDDYLYPSSYFVPIDLPTDTKSAIIKAA